MPLEKHKSAELIGQVTKLFARRSAGEDLTEFEIQQVLRDLKKYKSAFPEDTEIESEIGGAYCLLGKKKESEKHHLVALKFNPYLVRALVNYGLCLNIFGELVKSKDFFQKAATIQKDRKDYWERYINACLQTESYEEALEAIDRLLKLEDSHEYQELKSNIYAALAIQKLDELPPVDTSISGTEEERAKEEMQTFNNTKWMRQEVNKLPVG